MKLIFELNLDQVHGLFQRNKTLLDIFPILIVLATFGILVLIKVKLWDPINNSIINKVEEFGDLSDAENLDKVLKNFAQIASVELVEVVDVF